jgi:hypothetical protein
VYIPEDRTLHIHCCENLKSCIRIDKWWQKNKNKKEIHKNIRDGNKVDTTLYAIRETATGNNSRKTKAQIEREHRIKMKRNWILMQDIYGYEHQ